MKVKKIGELVSYTNVNGVPITALKKPLMETEMGESLLIDHLMYAPGENENELDVLVEDND